MLSIKYITGAVKNTLSHQIPSTSPPSDLHDIASDAINQNKPLSRRTCCSLISPHAHSKIDSRIVLDEENSAISTCYVLHPTFLGHSSIVIETYNAQEDKGSDMVASIRPWPRPVTIPELLVGCTKTGRKTIAVPTIERGDSLREKLKSELKNSKTWQIDHHNAQNAITFIETEANRTTEESNAYAYRLLGQFLAMSPDTKGGINCANWTEMVIRRCGIKDQGGILIDAPFTQCLPGTRSQWVFALTLCGMAALLYRDNYR